MWGSRDNRTPRDQWDLGTGSMLIPSRDCLEIVDDAPLDEERSTWTVVDSGIRVRKRDVTSSCK